MMKIKILIICFLITSLNSCTVKPALINISDTSRIERTVSEICVKQKPIEKVCAPVICPSIGLPAEIPNNLTLKIENGKVTSIDSGGKILLLNYMETYKLIKSTWVK